MDATVGNTIPRARSSARRQKQLALTVLVIGISALLGSMVRVLGDESVRFGAQDITLILGLIFILSLAAVLMHSAREQVSVDLTRDIMQADLLADLSQMEAVLKHLPFGVVVADGKTERLVLANQHFERYFGALVPAGASLRAAEVGRLADAGSLGQFIAPLRRALRNGEQVADCEGWVDSLDGARACLALNASPVLGPVGEVVAVVMVFADVTERKQMEVNQTHLLRRLVNAQEDVLARVAREMHDEMGQDLAALSLGLRDLEEFLLSEENKVRLGALRTIVESISSSVHRTAWTLRPTSLSDLGLMLALEELIGTWAHRLNVAVDTHLEALAEPLDDESSVTLYRVVQEALTNMAKHSNASAISVTAQRLDGFLRIAVEDDGRGFNPDRLRDINSGGFGLFGMQERLSLIGGSLTIESSVGRGTTVYASLPLNAVAGRRGPS